MLRRQTRAVRRRRRVTANGGRDGLLSDETRGTFDRCRTGYRRRSHTGGSRVVAWHLVEVSAVAYVPCRRPRVGNGRTAPRLHRFS